MYVFVSAATVSPWPPSTVPKRTRGRLTEEEVVQEAVIWLDGSSPKVRCRPSTGGAPSVPGVVSSSGVAVCGP